MEPGNEYQANDLSSNESDFIRQLASSEKKILLDLNSALNKCRAIVAFFNHSTEMREKLLAIQTSLNKSPLTLINDVKTRWYILIIKTK